MRHPLRLFLSAIALASAGGQAVHAQRTPDRPARIAYADSAWGALLRLRIAGNTGARWDPGSREWRLDPAWPLTNDAARPGYATEPDLRGALALAAATRDTARIGEIAGFYLAYLGRFSTVGETRAASLAVGGHSRLLPQGDSAARVLPWLDRQPGKVPWPSECALCTLQTLHPAARTLHLIARLGPGAATDVMRRFAAAYTPLLVRDVVVRFGFDTHWAYNGPEGVPFVIADTWRNELAGQAAHPYRMLDRDLWLLGISAELLAAHAGAPGLVPLAPSDSAKIADLLGLGLRMLERRQGLHPLPDGSSAALVFRGEFDTDPDMAYARDTGVTEPTPARRAPASNGGWDMSHLQRLPTVLRSLWDASPILPVPFPDRLALAHLLRQYVGVVYRPVGGWPRFTNFFDGSDGWYRVGLNGVGDRTYAPSSICLTRSRDHSCLSRGAAAGWQLLGFADSTVPAIADRLFQLAGDTTAAGVALRDRIWVADDDGFTWRGTGPGARHFSPLLAELVGETELGRTDRLP